MFKKLWQEPFCSETKKSRMSLKDFLFFYVILLFFVSFLLSAFLPVYYQCFLIFVRLLVFLPFSLPFFFRSSQGWKRRLCWHKWNRSVASWPPGGQKYRCSTRVMMHLTSFGRRFLAPNWFPTVRWMQSGQAVLVQDAGLLGEVFSFREIAILIMDLMYEM